MAVVGQGNPQWCGPPWYGLHGHQRSACCKNEERPGRQPRAFGLSTALENKQT